MKRSSFVLTALAVFFTGLLEAQSTIQVAATGYSFPSANPVAPGQVITLFVHGLNAMDAVANTAPLPTMLSGVSVRVKNVIPNGVPGYPLLLPIFSIHSYSADCSAGRVQFCETTAVTVQIPTEPTCLPSAFANNCTFGPLPIITVSIEQNGMTGQEFQFSIQGPAVQAHILNNCDTIMAQFAGCSPIITHANGHSITDAEPARPGETIVLYAVGLGSTMPTVKSGAPAPSPAPVVQSFVPLTVSFELDSPPDSPAPPTLWMPTGKWIKPTFAGLVTGFVGLYQVNFALPNTVPAQLHHCQGFEDTNTRLLLGGGIGQTQMVHVDTAEICLQP